MDALIIYPENKDQLAALKAMVKVMKVAFEQRSDIYPEHVVKGVAKSIAQAEAGELKPYTGIRNMLKP